LEHDTLNCGHDSCGACCGGSCTGCGGALELTRGELDLLQLFAQIPFLPVVGKYGSELPFFADEGTGAGESLGPVIAALERKRLIQVDYRQPLLNFDYSAYEPCSHKGSMALTTRGQEVLDLLEIQGIEP